MMKSFFRTQAVTAMMAVAVLAGATMTGCVDADPLPVKPYQKDVKLSSNVLDWRDEIIYQLIVDRFHNGDVNNDFNVDPRSLSRYQGGDWQGIIDKLDYLQELGVTTLWISPVVKNVEEDAGFASYHGYWTVDFLKHNPHFGDLATLRRLSDELHKRGMKLILDIVTNHVGQVFFYDINMNGQPNEWLAGSGEPDKGAPNTDVGPLSRVTEYDPDFDPKGIAAYTSMGVSGKAPIVYFDMPEISRTAPGPQNIDLDGDGYITSEAERLGFANKDWYHQRGRTFDYGNADDCTDYDAKACSCTHQLENFDGAKVGYLDGEERKYCQNAQTLLGDFPGGLKDLATERPDVRQALIDVFSYWIDVTDCDGFRIDTLKHVEYSFWETFAPAIRKHAAERGKKNFFMFGEAFDGNDYLLASYVENKNSVDSVFLFSQKYAIDQSFKCAPGNPSKSHCDGASGTAPLYGWDYTHSSGGRHAMYSNTPRENGIIDEKGVGIPPRDVLVNFLDNHDVARYLYDRNDEKGVDSLKNALSFLYTQRGIPCVYYGTEQGFMGGNDPANRENMSDPRASIFNTYPNLYPSYRPWDTKNPIFTHMKRLATVRKAVPALRRGAVRDNVWFDTDSSLGIYAFFRTYEGKSVMVVVNTHEKESGSTKNGGGMESPWGQGTVLVDLLDDTFMTVMTGNKVAVDVPPMRTRILVPKEDKAAYGL